MIFTMLLPLHVLFLMGGILLWGLWMVLELSMGSL